MKTKDKKKQASNQGLVPQLRFPEFIDEGEWEEAPLEKMASFYKGKGVSKSDISPNGVLPCVRYGELYTYYNETINLVQSYTDVSPEELVLSKANDVIIPASGETQEDIATASCVLKNGVALGGDLNILRTKINGVFLSYYLNSAKKKEISQLSQGISVVHLYANQLKKLNVNIPDWAEQQKIADCLSSLDELIAAQDHKLDTLKAHKKGLMQQLFPAPGQTAPTLRFPEFQDAGEWSIKPLGRVGKNLDYRRVPITKKERDKGDVPYYGASGIIDYVKDYIFDEELLCISEDGANLVARNYPIAFSILGKTWVNNHAHVLKFKEHFTQILIENYLNSISLEDFLTGMAQPKLNRAKLDIIPISLPELEEQQKIADCLSSLDELIAAQAHKLDILKVHKKGLMQKLFPNPEEVNG